MTGEPAPPDRDPFEGWPPLIQSAHVPRAVRLRDILLTLMMWAILLLMLASELHIAFQAWQFSAGRSEAEVDFALAEFADKLKPLMRLVGALVLALGVAALASKRRRANAIRAGQPAPLDGAILASRAGLSPQALAAAAAHPVVTVHRTPSGGLSVVPDPPHLPPSTV